MNRANDPGADTLGRLVQHPFQVIQSRVLVVWGGEIGDQCKADSFHDALIVEEKQGEKIITRGRGRVAVSVVYT